MPVITKGINAGDINLIRIIHHCSVWRGDKWTGACLSELSYVVYLTIALINWLSPSGVIVMKLRDWLV